MSAPASAVLRVEQVTKRFGRLAALQDITFEVRAGETVVLWGPNGAGKTTLLRCLLGVVPFEGTVTVLGADVRREGKRARRRVGYVPQEVRLHADQTVEETLRFYAALRGLPPSQATEALARWELAALAQRPVRALSGGMKQKLALAIALLGDPPVLLLDEPTSNLDIAARRELGRLLEQMNGAGKTLLMCSHRIGEIWKIADRVLALEQGRLVADGPPATLMGRVGRPVWLQLTVPRARVDEAAGLLEAAGWRVERNGMQMWVQVAGDRKAQPLELLVRERIPLLDLEVTDGT
jgi:ABC-type multidrug transport system ATPase subunit